MTGRSHGISGVDKHRWGLVETFSFLNIRQKSNHGILTLQFWYQKPMKNTISNYQCGKDDIYASYMIDYSFSSLGSFLNLHVLKAIIDQVWDKAQWPALWGLGVVESRSIIGTNPSHITCDLMIYVGTVWHQRHWMEYYELKRISGKVCFKVSYRNQSKLI